jgi:CBS domain-containing protein
MTPGLLTAKPDTPIVEAMRILVTHRITGIPVVDEHMNLLGVLSEKDVLPLLQDPRGESGGVQDFMTRDVTTFEADADVFDVVACLARSGFRRVPITEGGKLVGIISRSDLIMFILKHPSVLRQRELARS